MIIGIDGTRGINERAGIGRYTRNLVNEMAQLDSIDAQFLFTAMRGKREKTREIKRLIGKRQFRLKSIPGEWKNTIWGWPISLPDYWMSQVDLWHAPSIWEAPLHTHKSLVVTIHDMTPFLFPQLRGEKVSKNQRKRTIRVVKKADRLICISHATAEDLIKFVPTAKGKIAIVHLGVEENFQPLNYVKKEKIILAVGTIEPRKNLQLLFKAFLKLPKKLQDEYQIWIVGARGWFDSQIFGVAEALGDRIKFCGFLSDRELVEAYNKATIFAFPSLYEGFGLPLLEAMACGLPIIANNVSSIPEVVGDAAMLLTNDVDRWQASLNRLLTDASLRANMRHAGLRQAKKFSWRKMAEETAKVYDEIQR